MEGDSKEHVSSVERKDIKQKIVGIIQKTQIYDQKGGTTHRTHQITAKMLEIRTIISRVEPKMKQEQ